MKTIKKLILSLVFALVLTACGSDAPAAPVVIEDAKLNVIITAIPSGFSPLKTNDSASSSVNSQLYETLYKREMDGSGYYPLLAKELPVCTEDGLSCTITLNEGILFHDGKELTADDVKYTIESIKNPEYGSARASIASSIEEVVVKDKYTVELNLKYPDGVLLAKLAHTNSAIISEQADTSKDLMVDPVGTGPYKFVSYTSGSEVVLTRNEDYWGELSNIKDLVITIVTEPSTAIARLETGEADFLATIPVDQVERVESMANVNLFTKEGAGITYLGVRTTSSSNEVTYDKAFRQAVAYAIDREAWVESMGGYAVFSRSIIGPRVLGYTAEAENFGYPYDPEKAKELVAECGCGDEEIVFLTQNNPTLVALAEMVQSNLKEVGFNNVVIDAQEFATYLSESTKDNRFAIGIFTWQNVTGDGSELLEPNFTRAGSNRIKYANDEFEALVLQSKNTINLDDRIKALEAANKMILEDAVVVPLYNTYMIYGANKRLANVELDPGGLFYVNQMRVTE